MSAVAVTSVAHDFFDLRVPGFNLSEKSQRQRFTPAAIHVFFKIMAAWRLSDAQSRDLLGGVSRTVFAGWKKSAPKVLSADRITRITMLTGIFSALHTLHGADLADRWIHMPNTNDVFAGRTPLAFILSGGVPAMHMMRRLLDARASQRMALLNTRH